MTAVLYPSDVDISAATVRKECGLPLTANITNFNPDNQVGTLLQQVLARRREGYTTKILPRQGRRRNGQSSGYNVLAFWK